MNNTTSVTLHDAAGVELGPFRPKPTALTDGVEEASLTVWDSPDGRANAGVWECTPGSFSGRRDGYSEVCQLLSGRVTVEPNEGESVELIAGDTLVMPDGWTGVWHVHETVRKTYIIINS
ncbi:cupin domain-containing protein [Arthrobacter sp. S2(2024)]|uniref:cupin domain-containing protein n=1 Tax=Arthrobacter sp. S2(2024) TaxID=3111911 RepID=UPI002FCAE89B